MMKRRNLILGTLAAACGGMTCHRVLDADDSPAPVQPAGTRRRAGTELMTEDTKRAIEKGLAFLGRRQVTQGPARGALGRAGYPGGVAVCGLSGLAWMAGGSVPGRGPYGRHVQRCVEFLCQQTDSSGYISTRAQGGQDQMYGHGFATLFLSEAYGMSVQRDREEVLGKKLRAAVNLIVQTQSESGGWRYQPRKSDADLSITICQIMALRAARDAGINVPNETRKKCIDYVRKSQNADGGFRYTMNGGNSSFPLSAAGVVALNSAGIYDGPAVEKGLAFVTRKLPQESSASDSNYYYYGHYYAAQALWHAGGDAWTKWYTAMRQALLKAQRADGSWLDGHVGAEFGTAMACIILQLPKNYIPVFSEG